MLTVLIPFRKSGSENTFGWGIQRAARVLIPFRKSGSENLMKAQTAKVQAVLIPFRKSGSENHGHGRRRLHGHVLIPFRKSGSENLTFKRTRGTCLSKSPSGSRGARTLTPLLTAWARGLNPLQEVGEREQQLSDLSGTDLSLNPLQEVGERERSRKFSQFPPFVLIPFRKSGSENVDVTWQQDGNVS